MDLLKTSLLKFKSVRGSVINYQSLLNYSLSAVSTAPQSFKAKDIEIIKNKNPSKIPEDANKLLFGHVFSDHMFMAEWNKTEWSKPRIEPLRHLSLHPAAKVLHYAIELFEGMKAFRGVDGKIRLFRPEMNMSRMHRSALRSSLPDFDKDELLKCLIKYVSFEKAWVPKEPKSSLYLRPTFIATEPTLGVSEGSTALLYILGSPCGPYFPTGFKPVSLYADPTYCRAFYGGVGNFKVGSNYGPTVYVAKQAAKQSCQQVLWLYGDNHLITEAGTMNVFFVFKNDNNEVEILTPPLDGLILEGVTRQSILDLARTWGDVKVSERPIYMKELVKLVENNRLLEAFGAGTAAIACPIERILYKGKNYNLPTMKEGAPFMSRAAKELNDIYYGLKKHDWGVVVD